MSKLLFFCKNALQGFKTNKRLNRIVLVSIMVGMIYPIIACTISEGILSDVRLSEYADADHTAIAEFFAPYTVKSDMDKKLKGLTEDIDELGYQVLYQVTANWKKENYVAGIAGYSDSYLKMEGYRLLAGRIPTKEEMEEGKPVCLIQVYSNPDIKVGDAVSFMGHSYEVVGIIHIPKTYGSILIPYKSMESFIGKNSLQYKVTIRTKQEPNTRLIQANLKFVDSILNVQTVKEQNIPYYKSVWSIIKQRMGIGLIVLAFAILSMSVIIIGKTIDEQYMIGVKMALGASGFYVFIELFLKNSILMIMAMLLDYLLFPIIKQYYKAVRTYPDIWVTIVMLCVVFVISFVISLVGTIIILRKKSISGLLQKLK